MINLIKNSRLILFLVMMFVLNLTSLPDKTASNYIDNALSTTATAYLAARGINATISVLQDVELSIGVATVSPGELLDPLNDLIERFSTVMLYATASLGIQKILLSISGWLLIKIIVALLIVLLILTSVFSSKGSLISKNTVALIYKPLVFLLALRFCIPVMAIANGIVEDIFIKDDINTHISELQKIETSTKELSKLKNHPTHSDKQNTTDDKEPANSIYNYLQKIKESVSETANTLVP